VYICIVQYNTCTFVSYNIIRAILVSSCVRVQIYPLLYSKTSYNLFILHLINEAWLFKRLKTFPYIFLIVRSNKSFKFLLLDVVFFHSDTFYGQRLLSLKNNGKVHLHLIVQNEKIRTFLDPIRANIGRSRGTNKGRSLDEFIRCRIKYVYICIVQYITCTFVSYNILLVHLYRTI